MAKENKVTLRGYVRKDPQIFVNEDGTPAEARLRVITIKRIPDPEIVKTIALTFSELRIITKNQRMIKEIAKIKAGDFIDGTGVLTTKIVLKSKICPVCQGNVKNSVEGSMTYITPLFIEVLNSGLSDEEGLQLLQKRSEVSNVFQCIGALVRDVNFYFAPEKPNTKISQYQLAINRKYTIKEDGPEIKTDYPWVKTFGEQALEDSETLSEGSVVYINGFLQSRIAKRNLTCSECGAIYDFNDEILEILPWGVEYLFKNKDETVKTEEYAEDKLQRCIEDSIYVESPE